MYEYIFVYIVLPLIIKIIIINFFVNVEIHGNLCISLSIIMEYSFSYLLSNENTCKTQKKQVFQNNIPIPRVRIFTLYY
jgi:hypothetical protein